ncbi:MAG: ABC transporter substrate-binding protein [Candidatus Promineifilaceae bacterium]|nr:ABC transporter substrate-binding protein [Candidatus Promineifilaceae bacterium]
MRRKLITLIVLMIALAFILASCGGSAEAPAPAEESSAEETSDTETTEEEAQESEPAAEDEPAGDVVINTFAMLGDDDALRFKDTIKSFEEETGYEVVIETSQDTAQLTVRAEAGTLPDVILFPQPGLMADFAREGHLVPLDDAIDMDAFREAYSDTWIDLGSVDGSLYAVPFRLSVKSLVWYPRDDWEATGYEFPETWDELMALTDQMVADGRTPWCIGMESGAASGWPGTDWIEDIMLRTAGAEKYDQWVAGELKFDSPEVRRAFETLGELVFDDQRVLGGPTTVATTFFGDSPIPMFEDPPGCWLHHQATFIAGYLPEDVVGENIADQFIAFYLPPIDEEYGRPVLGAGNMMAAASDRPEVQEFLQFLATPEAFETWVKDGNFISAHQGVPLDWYPDEIMRSQAEILLNADTFRFDGSDLMPGEVGTGSFWAEMINWVTGQDLDTTLQNIDATWPE